MSLQINIDNGGTLTDICILSDKGNFKTKVLTTPYDLSKCFFDGLQKASELLFGEANVKKLLEEIDLIRYSTTQGTNAICERKGPKLGLISDQNAQALAANLREQDTEVFDALVGNRIAYIDTSSSDLESQVVKIVNKLSSEGANRLVISISSDDFKSVENQIKKMILRRYPRHLLGAVPVLYASDLIEDNDAIRRTWSALINSFLHPSMEAFLFNAENRLRDYRTKNPLLIFKNDGKASRVAKTIALKTYSSGPRGGMEGVKHFSKQYGFRDTVSIDVGGTTTDIGQCTDDVVKETRRGSVEGIPVSFPLCHIISAGAGGSSVFCVKDGQISIGPESVGSFPGPAAFGRGGKKATITDASLIAGLFDPKSYFGGGMGLDLDAAKQVIQDNIAIPLSLTTEQAILAMRDAFTTKVAKELDHETDLAQDTVMMAFGGAGPLYACEIADKAGLKKVAMPAMAAVFSAYGIGACDIAHQYTVLVKERTTQALETELNMLKQKAARDMYAEGFSEGQYELKASLILVNQGQETYYPFQDIEKLPAELAHAEVAEIELSAVKILRTLDDKTVAVERKTRAQKTADRCFLLDQNGYQDLPVYRLNDMQKGDYASGPAILEEDFFTAVIPATWVMVVSDLGDVILEKEI